MSDNFFVQHPEVMEHIMKHEAAAREIEQEKLEEAWQDLQSVPSYVERHADGTYQNERMPS